MSTTLLEWGNVKYGTVRQTNGWRRAKLLERGGHTCVFCLGASGDEALSLDHIIPQHLSGANTPDNFVVSCVSCNSTKKHASLDVLIVRLERKGISGEGLVERVEIQRLSEWR